MPKNIGCTSSRSLKSPQELLGLMVKIETLCLSNHGSPSFPNQIPISNHCFLSPRLYVLCFLIPASTVAQTNLVLKIFCRPFKKPQKSKVFLWSFHPSPLSLVCPKLQQRSHGDLYELSDKYFKEKQLLCNFAKDLHWDSLRTDGKKIDPGKQWDSNLWLLWVTGVLQFNQRKWITLWFVVVKKFKLQFTFKVAS